MSKNICIKKQIKKTEMKNVFKGKVEMKKRKENEVENMVVNTKTIASMIGVTDRRVRQMAEEGIIEKVGHGRFELMDTMRRYIDYLRNTGEASAEEMDLVKKYDHEKMLHEAAKREAAELKLAVMKGSLHEAEVVEKVMTKMLSTFRAKILAIPSKVAPVLIARNEIAVIQDLIQKEIYETLEEFSDYDPKMYRGEKYIDFDDVVEEDEDSEEEDDEEESENDQKMSEKDEQD